MANIAVVEEEIDDDAMRRDLCDVTVSAEKTEAGAGSSNARVDDGTRGPAFDLEEIGPSLSLILTYTQSRRITESNDTKMILVFGRVEIRDFARVADRFVKDVQGWSFGWFGGHASIRPANLSTAGKRSPSSKSLTCRFSGFVTMWAFPLYVVV